VLASPDLPANHAKHAKAFPLLLSAFCILPLHSLLVLAAGTAAGTAQCASDLLFVQVSAGNGHTVAVKRDGTLWPGATMAMASWGMAPRQTRAARCKLGRATNWQTVAAGWCNTVAVRGDGTLWAWGYNYYGQLGDGTTNNKSSPVQIGTAANWQTVAPGDAHTVGIRSDGTLWAWGSNAYGQLGNSTTNSQNSPVQIGTATNWQTVAAGGAHTVAVRSDGRLWAWGLNTSGQLGMARRTTRAARSKLGPRPTGRRWRRVITTRWRSGATAPLGLGYNYYGQLGDGTTASKSSPVQIGTAANWQTVQQVGTTPRRSGPTAHSGPGATILGELGMAPRQTRAAGPNWTATNWQSVTRVMGTRWRFGATAPSGSGATTKWPVGTALRQPAQPGQIGTATNWQTVRAGTVHTLGMRSDGTLWAWATMAMADWGMAPRSTRAARCKSGWRPTGRRWRRVVHTRWRSGATARSGPGQQLLWPVGGWHRGQREQPVQIGTASNWQTVAAGYYHTVGVRSDGTLWGWGYNFWGQLGMAPRSTRSSRCKSGRRPLADGGSGLSAHGGRQA